MEKESLSIEDLLNKETPVQDQIDDLIFALIRARKKKKISQTELAEMSGVNQTIISKLETFRSNPSLQTLIKLAQALDLTLTFK